MKRALSLAALAAILGAGSLSLHSQAPAPAGTPVGQLKAIRDQNAKLLEQQAATLQKLDEIEKTSQTIKVLGKRA